MTHGRRDPDRPPYEGPSELGIPSGRGVRGLAFTVIGLVFLMLVTVPALAENGHDHATAERLRREGRTAISTDVIVTVAKFNSGQPPGIASAQARVTDPAGRTVEANLLDVSGDVATPPGRYPSRAVRCLNHGGCDDLSTPLLVRYLPADPAVAMTVATYELNLQTGDIRGLVFLLGIGLLAILVLLVSIWRRLNDPNRAVWPPDPAP